jgi:hypothetical protein
MSVSETAQTHQNCRICLGDMLPDHHVMGHTHINGRVDQIVAKSLKDVASQEKAHLFHEECLIQWLDENEICPICRAAIRPVGMREALLASRAVISEADRGEAVKLAAAYGFREVIQGLLANGAVISEEDRGGAVKLAATYGFREVIQELLANGAVISQEKRGQAVLGAALGGSLLVIQDLLANGAVISEADRRGAVLWAARNNHLDVVRFFLQNQPVSNGDRGEILIYAARHGDFDLVQNLLANGATIPYEVKQRAARAAEVGGYRDIVNFLNPPVFFETALILSTLLVLLIFLQYS